MALALTRSAAARAFKMSAPAANGSCRALEIAVGSARDETDESNTVPDEEDAAAYDDVCADADAE